MCKLNYIVVPWSITTDVGTIIGILLVKVPQNGLLLQKWKVSGTEQHHSGIYWHMLLQTFWPENKMWILYSQLRAFTPQSSLPEVTSTIIESWLCEPLVMLYKWGRWWKRRGVPAYRNPALRHGSPYSSCISTGRLWGVFFGQESSLKRKSLGGRKKRVQLKFETS